MRYRKKDLAFETRPSVGVSGVSPGLGRNEQRGCFKV